MCLNSCTQWSLNVQVTLLQAFHLKPSNRTKCKFFSFTVLKLLYALTSSQKI